MTKVPLPSDSVFRKLTIMEMRSDDQSPEEDCSIAPELYAHSFSYDWLGSEHLSHQSEVYRKCAICGIPEPEELSD